MNAKVCFTLVGLLLLISSGLSSAQSPPDSSTDRAWNDAWSYSSAVTIMDDFERIYLPHAEALFAASEKLALGESPQSVAARLNALPGARGTVFVSIMRDAFQVPEGMLQPDVFPDRFLERLQRPLAWRAPMLKRKLGGQIRYETIVQGDESLHFIVRYILRDTLSPPDEAIFLLLDPGWFRPQIVSRMDSLAHENRQLLFWAASPTNHIKDQSLGILCDGDTLWWTGPRDVKVTCVQPLWPFGDSYEIHSHLRSTKSK